MANREISEGRKGLYYLGMVLMILGFISFASVFVTIIMQMGGMRGGGFGQHAFDDARGNMQSSAIRGFLGMGLIIAGGFLRSVGARGLAGSGIVLDPQRARREVEPWSRMTGGMVKDVVEESGLIEALSGRSSEVDGSSSNSEGREPDFDEKLRKLHQLREDGILSEEEYEREKAEVLNRN